VRSHDKLVRQAKWAEPDASNVVATRFLFADGVDAVQGRIVETGTNAGTQGFYVTDNLGSVRDIIRASTGAIAYHADYDAFGTATEYGSGFGDTLKYTAREFDADTGLQYNRARWYDAKVGRWLSEDAIGFAAGDHNLYRYVSNFTTGAIDPSGMAGVPFPPPPGVKDDKLESTIVGDYSERGAYKTLFDQAVEWKQAGYVLAHENMMFFLSKLPFKRNVSPEAIAHAAEESDRAVRKAINLAVFDKIAKAQTLPVLNAIPEDGMEISFNEKI
jgi:RHS repeat-associated protein